MNFFEWIVSLFQPSLEGELKAFTKAATNLEKVALNAKAKAEKKEKAAEKALTVARASTATATKALNVKGNLEKLLGE